MTEESIDKMDGRQLINRLKRVSKTTERDYIIVALVKKMVSYDLGPLILVQIIISLIILCKVW